MNHGIGSPQRNFFRWNGRPLIALSSDDGSPKERRKNLVDLNDDVVLAGGDNRRYLFDLAISR